MNVAFYPEVSIDLIHWDIVNDANVEQVDEDAEQWHYQIDLPFVDDKALFVRFTAIEI